MPFLPDREALPPSVTSMKEFQRNRFGQQMENQPVPFSGVSASNSGISGYILRNDQTFDSRQQMYDRPVQYRHDPFTVDPQYEDNFVPVRIPTPGPYYAQSQPASQWNRPAQQLPPQYQSQPYHLEMPAPEAYPYIAPIRQNSLLEETIGGPYWGPTNQFAPMLHPAAIHIPGTSNSSSPPNFMNYASYGPSDRLSCLTYTDPSTFTKEDITHAFAVWYVKEVIGVLVYPGSFRAGTGGSAEEEWGPGGRARDGWLRIGRQPPDYSHSWGRMGMTATPVQPYRRKSVRDPEIEPHDPWRVAAWGGSGRPSSSLILFVQDLLQRMSISPTSVVTAAYFLHRLGLHEGDGEKGEKLRRYLRQSNFAGPEPIEKRVAMLGLILAGKWLDDNSFLTKSWTEVTYISIDEIDIMERYALQDLYHSLFIPSHIWGEHVQTLLNSLLRAINPENESYIVCVFLDAMLSETRQQEDEPPVRPTPNFERRLSAEELPAAADQALSKDWGDYVRPYVNNMTGQVGFPSNGPTVRLNYDMDSQMTDMLYQRSALDDEEMEDGEEEEYLEYDGAQRWLPSIAELRRSGSGSSGTEVVNHTVQPSTSWSNTQHAQAYDTSNRLNHSMAPPSNRFASSMESHSSFYSNSPTAAMHSPSFDPAIVEIGQSAYFDPAISMIVPQDSPLSQRGESRVWHPTQWA